MGYEGELAAGLTAVLWAVSALLFTLAGRQIGADVVNVTRLAIAMVLIAITHWFVFGSLFPWQTEPWRWSVLATSAVVGLVIGDGALFWAFVKIGPRLAMLIMSLVPVLTSLLAWICFGEIILPLEYLGIGITVAAVAWVVSEPKSRLERKQVKGELPPPSHAPDSREFLTGVILALVGALGQTGNLIITKYALVDEYSELSATELRILVSLVFLLVWAAARGKLVSSFRKLQHRKAFWQTSLGALIGPFLGIWFSYIAIQHGRIGIAATIISLSPLLLIPLSAMVLHEKISRRATIGTLIAMAGVAVLCLTSP